MVGTSFGQDLDFKLSGAIKRKWVGDQLITASTTENTTDLVFYRNHKVAESNRKYGTAKKEQSWDIVSGQYIDDHLRLRIGNRTYTLEFSTTSNGRDFITLTSGGENEGGEYVVKTFYAE